MSLDAGPVDIEFGTRRARAAALLMLALPGVAYLYQGEELGLPEVDDLPTDVLQDPIWERSGHRIRGRDGCRVPLPWSDAMPALGFGTGKPWLPQPPQWSNLSVEAQTHNPDSMLTLYREALRLRCTYPAFLDSHLRWVEAPDRVMAFKRGENVTCLVNFATKYSSQVDCWTVICFLLTQRSGCSGRDSKQSPICFATFGPNGCPGKEACIREGPLGS
jgi:alpha-glucosidase